ncbi:unnamed protein product [Mycena citricolor]|uniref:Uncharacterized protein n=1 Tax=Mycena citricolor TaxID=2018698 RepID=A0AAD2GVP6_9AGAR|nr:unnamed protein product [Mycena citricolor]CAK5279712.1 unnamed protein product [Mycena citricolor]
MHKDPRARKWHPITPLLTFSLPCHCLQPVQDFTACTFFVVCIRAFSRHILHVQYLEPLAARPLCFYDDPTPAVPMPSSHRTTLSQARFLRLSAVLSQANVRYHHIAKEAKESSAPSGHARALAHKHRLFVNTRKAANCPQNVVSRIPLPIVEQVHTHVHIRALSTQDVPARGRKISRPPHSQRPSLNVVIPRSDPRDVPVSGEFSAVSLGSAVSSVEASIKPILYRQAPCYGAGACVSTVSSEWMETLFAQAPRKAPLPPIKYVDAHLPKYMPSPVIPDFLLDSEFGMDDVDNLTLLYPDDFSHSSTCSRTSSSTTASAASPVIPPDALLAPVRGGKRKSICVESASPEKRPKVCSSPFGMVQCTQKYV